MAVSATIINREELGIEFSPHLIDIPVSLQRIYKDYWEPIIDTLELPTLGYIGVLDVDYTLWSVVKDELIQMRKFVKENSNVVEFELCKDPTDINVVEYIVGRIDNLIKNMQEAYDLSDKVIYNI